MHISYRGLYFALFWLGIVIAIQFEFRSKAYDFDFTLALSRYDLDEAYPE